MTRRAKSAVASKAPETLNVKGTPAGARRVAEYREIVTKVVNLLSEKKINVTQRGIQAYVRYTPKGEVEVLNLPYIPDDATEELISAVRGFLDHEVGHVLDTDHTAAMKVINRYPPSERPRIMRLFNILEDPRIERTMRRRFPGSGANISYLNRFITEHFVVKRANELEAAGDKAGLFGLLITPAIAAMSGCANGEEACKLLKVEERIGDQLKVIKTFAHRMPGLTSTQDVCDLASEIYEAMKKAATPPPPPPPPPPAASPAEESEEGEGGEGEGGEGEGGESETPPDTKEEPEVASESDPSDGEEDASTDEALDPDEGEDDAGEPSEPSEEPAEPDAGGEGEDDAGEPEEDDGSAGGSAGADAGDESEGEGEGSDGDLPEDSLDEPEFGAGESIDSFDEGEDESDPAEGTAEDDLPGTGDEGEAADEESLDEQPDITPETETPASGSMDDTEEELEEHDNPEAAEIEFDPSAETALDGMDKPTGDPATAIGELVRSGIANDTYLPYTLDHDKWVDPEIPVRDHARVDSHIAAVDNETRHMVGTMQAHFRRLFAQQDFSAIESGLRRGRIHSPNLHRLITGDDRVFARREEVHATDTAITLLIDCSGSMSGSKIELAAKAAYVFSQTLDRVNITHEVLGFSTDEDASGDYESLYDHSGELAGSAKRTWSRMSPIAMYKFKTFEERCSVATRRKILGAPTHIELANNVDGESVLLAAGRLGKRREPRKILMVFSDGYPAANGNSADLNAHLKFAVKECERRRIETIGIGIMSTSVAQFYPKHVVLNDVSKLPQVVVGELQRFLIGSGRKAA